MIRCPECASIPSLMLVVGLLGGCTTAETEIENAEKAGVDPMDAAFAPLDDTVDEINEKLNAPRDGASGNTD